jgi:conjugal transfer pilus assembly protein TraB
MSSFELNHYMAKLQKRNFVVAVIAFLLIVMAIIFLMSDDKPKKKVQKENVDLVGVIDESFGQANTNSALTAQQAELETLKTQVSQLQELIKNNEKIHAKETENLSHQLATAMSKKPEPGTSNLKLASNGVENNQPWQADLAKKISQQAVYGPGRVPRQPQIHSLSFQYHHPIKKHHINPENYVPSGTFVKAVILGGADADASVNGQSKNNGVMLFKLVAPGTLPNDRFSHLQGCFVTGSSYGDISSERAYVILDKLSCAEPGKPIIDKSVTGWAFFGGKVGIKGLPLMRDTKVMQWAGISGAMSGVAAAAQYSRSVQSISPLGSATTVPSGNIAPYAAYGGASKAAEVLSDYYVKRAEQYHPVIQVGAGNFVTIVFKDGFFLEPDEMTHPHSQTNTHSAQISRAKTQEIAQNDEELDFAVPPEVLNKISNSPSYGVTP